jgi:hypothetical protein
MIKPTGCQSDSLCAYQQVLDDFGITELLNRLRNFSDTNFNAAYVKLEEQELENLAVILIRELANNLQGKLIADYLNLMRQDRKSNLSGLVHLKFPSPSIELPANFSNVQTPRFLYSDKLRWISVNGDSDFGTVIGRFYSFAPHSCEWQWSYLIWLDKNSLSSVWIIADTAFEEDLEPVEEEES